MSQINLASRGTTAVGTNDAQFTKDNDPTLITEFKLNEGQEFRITDLTFWCKGEAILEIQQNNDLAGAGTWFTRKSVNLAGNGNVGDLIDTPVEIRGDAGPDVNVKVVITDDAGGNEYGFDIEGPLS